MALVMWEVLRRTRIGNQETPEYQHPYYDHVETDPNIDEMKNIVVKYRHRPEFDDEICKFAVKRPPGFMYPVIFVDQVDSGRSMRVQFVKVTASGRP